jgi:hypothetical protein
MQNNVEYGCIFKESLRVCSKEFFSQLLVNLNLDGKIDFDQESSTVKDLVCVY